MCLYFGANFVHRDQFGFARMMANITEWRTVYVDVSTGVINISILNDAVQSLLLLVVCVCECVSGFGVS